MYATERKGLSRLRPAHGVRAGGGDHWGSGVAGDAGKKAGRCRSGLPATPTPFANLLRPTYDDRPWPQNPLGVKLETIGAGSPPLI
ncbi:hypothetical protein N7539_002845 [Penicillium diatomitis]|uniref:Uncharacterized protein n=1 Tax=Penicillium diatomitis TaxID=2819901 RepID=A0A9X0BZH0_9EURO|nr:uncharacterized protein N7539_002845 [Penicillium diatomitis]KAJ5491278.1 hypothetical protein N7539_002845 [Penicillium diatomitis]